MRSLTALLIAVTAIACGPEPKPDKPELVASSPRLPAPQPVDPHVRGAAYLTALANQIQPRWERFLEDCRLRLPAGHVLNQPSVFATVELRISTKGPVIDHKMILGSGYGDFDTAVVEIVGELAPPAPPPEIVSDDDEVHVRWMFARDRRQAGPATAEVMMIELPLELVIQRWAKLGELKRAVRRLLAASPDDAALLPATEQVMTLALAEGLASSDSDTRTAALDSAARLNVRALARDVRGLIDNGATRSRVQAIATAAALDDKAVVPLLLDGLDADLEARPEIGLAKLAALVSFGEKLAAGRAIEQRKSGVSIKTTVAALAIVPDPKLTPEIVKWFGRGDSEGRQAICDALPAAALDQTTKLLARGLRDADATVRAACATAASRQGKRGDRATIQRLVELARDRDELVRARAIAALGVLDVSQRRRGIDDRSAQVRAAYAIGASEAELRTLAKDKDPDVRAAALSALDVRAGELAVAAAVDQASHVRRAAVAGIADDALLEKLAGDSDPEVATAALVRYATRRGRAAITAQLLQRLVAATPKSLERVRIARAWLLAQ